MYTILVCDDERDIVSALEIYLTAEGYRVLKAYTARMPCPSPRGRTCISFSWIS